MNLTKEEKDIIFNHLTISHLHTQKSINYFQYQLEVVRCQGRTVILFNKRDRFTVLPVLKNNKNFLLTLRSLIKKFNCLEKQSENS
tara:strand:+ start:212 stop:469 length:258 start_codon:yes stop_codon:yes gene_type:complete